VLNRPADIWDVTWGILTGELYTRRHEWITPRVVSPALDVGCGQGYQGTLIALEGHDIRGMDLHPGLVALSSRMAEANGVTFPVSVGNVYQIDYPDTSFETIVCTEVLEHLDDPGWALKEMARVGKRLLLSTPGFGAMRIPGHIQDFTEEDLAELVSVDWVIVEHVQDHPWQYVEAVRK
jgi:2-polyprenyl-3-methyl-5-hydroxy-6-metoxy-1,4-benzoquinol methylase